MMTKNADKKREQMMMFSMDSMWNEQEHQDQDNIYEDE